MWDTIANFIKDWGTMTPTRKLSTLMMVGLFVLCIKIYYQNIELKEANKEMLKDKDNQILKCENRVSYWENKSMELESELRNYLLYDNRFKKEIDSLLEKKK